MVEPTQPKKERTFGSVIKPILINLLEGQKELSIRIKNSQRHVFDPVRKKWLVFTPEEFVRQLLIIYFHSELAIPYSRMSLEKGFTLNNLYKRYDIVIYNRKPSPILLVECKASSIPISQQTFDQIFEYNLSLEVPFLVVSNGRNTYCLQKEKPYKFLERIPDFSELCQISNEE